MSNVISTTYFSIERAVVEHHHRSEKTERGKNILWKAGTEIPQHDFRHSCWSLPDVLLVPRVAVHILRFVKSADNVAAAATAAAACAASVGYGPATKHVY